MLVQNTDAIAPIYVKWMNGSLCEVFTIYESCNASAYPLNSGAPNFQVFALHYPIQNLTILQVQYIRGARESRAATTSSA